MIELLIIAILAFICAYIDVTFGMGYGTLMCPILLIFNFEINTIVPVLLVSQLCTGFTACLFHKKLKNMNFRIKDKETRMALSFTFFGAIAMMIATFVIMTVPNAFIMLYISMVIISIGFALLLKLNFVFSWKKMYWIGGFSAFNKALSGGGFGPIITSSQIMLGSEIKNAVAVTSFSETILSAIGFIFYLLLTPSLDITLTFIVIISGILATPLGTLHVKKMKRIDARRIIGFLAIFLGTLTLIKCIF